MADGEDGEREVLTSLPRSRPVRRSSKRGERGGSTTAETKPAGGTTRTAPAPKRSAAKQPKRKPDPEPAATKTEPKLKAESKPKAEPKPKAGARPEAERKPRIAPERKVPPAGYAAPSKEPDDDSTPGPTEILVTAVQAATELAQIGFSVGRQALQSALERLPKP